MLDHYKDIRERIEEPPTWFDRHGVPRYCPAIPGNHSHVYADRLAFVRIECQACGHSFLVEFADSTMDRIIWNDRYKAHVGEEPPKYDPTKLHYGDPPNIGCCAAGATMNSVPRVLVSAYEKEHLEWKQTHENVPMHCDWMDDE